MASGFAVNFYRVAVGLDCTFGIWRLRFSFFFFFFFFARVCEIAATVHVLFNKQ